MISVSEELYDVYIATLAEDSGKWVKVTAHIVKIDELGFSILARMAKVGIELDISELTSGCRFIKLWIDPITFLECDTKEKTIELFCEEAQKIEKLINEIGKEKVIEEIKKMQRHVVEIFGVMPEIKKSSIQI